MAVRSKILVAVCGLLLAISVSAWWLVLSPPAVPADSSFELELSEVRRIALEPSAPLPSHLNVLVVAETEKPLIGALGGLHWGTFVMPWTAFQIAYSDSFLVVDAAADPSLHRERNAQGRFYADRYSVLQHALRRASSILFTHEHPDHLGGVARSPHLRELKQRLLLTEEQISSSLAEGSSFPEAVRAQLRPLSYERHLRLAPGVVLIKAPGHTPGSQIVYVRLQSEREYLLIGDIAWHRLHFQEPRGHPRLSAWLLGEHLPSVLAQLRSLHEAWQNEAVVVVPSHDGLFLAELVASGVLGSGFE